MDTIENGRKASIKCPGKGQDMGCCRSWCGLPIEEIGQALSCRSAAQPVRWSSRCTIWPLPPSVLQRGTLFSFSYGFKLLDMNCRLTRLRHRRALTVQNYCFFAKQPLHFSREKLHFPEKSTFPLLYPPLLPLLLTER